MSQYSSKDVGFVLVDGYSLLGTVTTLQDNVEAILQETTVLGSDWAIFASVGVSKGALSQGGFYDDAAGSVNAALVASMGLTRVFVYNLEGNTVGTRFIGFSGAVQAKYERILTLEKLHVANALYNPTGPVEQGQLLHAHTTEAAAGNTQATSVDNGVDVHNTSFPITSNSVANPTQVTTTVPHGLSNGDIVVISGVSGSTPTINGTQTVTVTGLTTFTVPVNATIGGTGGSFIKARTTNGGGAYLAVSALVLGGYTDLTVKVQHSADNITFVDLVTFTAATAAPFAERKAVASGTTVNQYLASSWAFSGAGAGPSAKFVVGFSRA